LKKTSSRVARDLNDLFLDGELDLSGAVEADVPRMPVADAEDLWLAEVARRPDYLDITKVGDRHLTAEAKLILSGVKALHRARSPIDRETFTGEVFKAAVKQTWEGWNKKGDPPELEPRTMLRRLRVVDAESNLTFAEDVLVRAYSEAKYGEALSVASRIAREDGMAAAQRFMRDVEVKIEAADAGVKWHRAVDLGQAVVDELRAALTAPADTFVTSGFARLDQLTRGWYRRRQTAIGGWPGHGKSTLALQLMVAMALSNQVGLISIEDEPVILMTRILMHQMEQLGMAKRLATLRPGGDTGYTGGDVDVMQAFVAEVISKMKLSILSDGPWTMEKVRAAIIAAGRSGCAVVGVDYLQAVPVEGDSPGAFYDRCVTAWKDACRVANVHLIVASQLRRASGRAGDRDERQARPAKDDFYYCPKMEQASEYILLCHRLEIDRTHGPLKDKETANIIIAKAKDGELGVHSTTWCRRKAMYDL
jgi:replicative DNA helicase